MEQVKVEPEVPVSGDLATTDGPAKPETGGTALEHDIVFIKTEKNDFFDEEDEEAIEDTLSTGDQNQSNSGELPESECVEIKVEPSACYDLESEQTDEWKSNKDEESEYEDDSYPPFMPVSAEIGDWQEPTNLCSYATVREDRPAVHKRTAEEKIQCLECDCSFARKDHLKRHMRLHSGEMAFKCAMCDYAATRKDHLVQHLQRKHSRRWKALECSECDYSTRQNDLGSLHVQKHPSSDNLKRVKGTCQNTLKCLECDYTASRNHNLIRHVQVHTKPKIMFECLQCNYRARRKDYLARHVQKHRS